MTNIVDAAEAEIAKVATWTQHAAAAVLGWEAIAQNDVQQLEATSPLVSDAIAAGKAFLLSKGVPLPAIEATAEEVLALVKQVDSTSAPTTKPIAGSPADPAVIAAAPPIVAVPATP
jgi:hypothetical protein